MLFAGFLLDFAKIWCFLVCFWWFFALFEACFWIFGGFCVFGGFYCCLFLYIIKNSAWCSLAAFKLTDTIFDFVFVCFELWWVGLLIWVGLVCLGCCALGVCLGACVFVFAFCLVLLAWVAFWLFVWVFVFGVFVVCLVVCFRFVFCCFGFWVV